MTTRNTRYPFQPAFALRFFVSFVFTLPQRAAPPVLPPPPPAGMEPLTSSAASPQLFIRTTANSLLMDTATSSSMDAHSRAMQVVVRGRGKRIMDFAPGVIEQSSPHLWPWGYGGPDSPIPLRTPCSRESRLCHLPQTGGRFADDPVLPFQTHQITARGEASKQALISIKHRVNQPGRQAIVAATDVDVEAHVQAQIDRRDAIAAGLPPPPLSTAAERGKEYCREVDSVTKHVFGSNAERRELRKQIWDYTHTFGSPALFFTLSVHDTGVVMNGVRAGLLSALDLFSAFQTGTLPAQLTKDSLFRTVMDHPIATARTFLDMVDAFIADVLQWDVEAQAPFARVGLFGHTKVHQALPAHICSCVIVLTCCA